MTWFAVLSVLLYLSPALGQSSFRLSNVYADEMVLQMEPKSSNIWGWGDTDAAVRITLNSETFLTTVGADGKWSIRLPPQPAGGPHVLDILYNPISGPADTSTLTVYFGDVWVCSGQSNMQMFVRDVFNSTEETAKALTYTNLRLMLVNMEYSDTEYDEIGSIGVSWGAPTEENLPEFAALCLFFGERITDTIGDRPIGLIATTWWGTPIEAWSSPRVLTYCNTPPGTDVNQNQDHVLWNAMIKPLTPLAVRGAIWYQGETNAGYNQDYYPCHIQRLIADWRDSFVDGNVPVPAENNLAFPFGIVQIGPYLEGDDLQYGSVRWHQTVNQGVIPNVYLPESFMAASYDTTDPDSPTGNIHPRDKQTIADRLANSAKNLIYNEPHNMYGPVVVSTSVPLPGFITLTYDSDILVNGVSGFSYRLPNGDWVETTISNVSGRDVTLSHDPTATHLAFGFFSVVCEYKQCPIYAADVEALPAQIWVWDLAQLEAQRR